MSFILDPPSLFVIGIALYYIGNIIHLERPAKIIIALLVVLTFIVFSMLLYADVFRCVFPILCNNLSGSEFMFHSNITGIYKEDVPLIIVIFMFALYPFWIYLGYAFILMRNKRKKRLKYSKEVKSKEDVSSRKEKAESVYSVVRYPDCKSDVNDRKHAVRRAVENLGGIKKYVNKGDKVLIKVNICGGVPNEPATYTSHEVAGAVLELVREAGGTSIICDADMVWTNFWTNAEAQGWIEWAEKENVIIENPIYARKTKRNNIGTQKMKDRLINLSDTKILYFNFGRDSVFSDDGKERVSEEILEADVIISVAAMKTHMMTGVTLGMKNMYGTFPEIDKARYHKFGINEVIYYVNSAFTPNLTIIDGSIGGESIGPLSCEPVDFHTIIASNDVVTADSIAVQLMGFDDPMEIKHIELAHRNGVGDASLEFDFNSLPYKHDKDGDWNLSAPEVGDFYTSLTHKLLKVPTWEIHFNMLSDFFLYDASRLPILKYINHAVLQCLNDLSRWILNKKKLYLFTWDEIPGNDNWTLSEFLRKKYDIDWVRNAIFEKSSDGTKITLSNEGKVLSLELNEEKTGVDLKISGGKIGEMDARRENNKLKIYEKKIELEEKKEFIFTWKDIPGDDDTRLLEYLKSKFHIDWQGKKHIEKIEDGNTIKISNEKNIVTLKLNNEQSGVKVITNNGGTDKLVAEKEEHTLKIYSRLNIYKTIKNKVQKDLNLMIFSIVSVLAIFGFVKGGYLANSSFDLILGFAFVLIFACLLSSMMKTDYFVVFLLVSGLVSFVVERYGVLSGMWKYIDGGAPPLFSIFSTPFFFIVILGISSMLKAVFSYVHLNGRNYQYVPFILTAISMAVFMIFEGYDHIISQQMIIIYLVMIIIGLYYNNRQGLEWNLAFMIVAITMGGTMEMIGISSGVWDFAFGEGLPVFISFGWALNAWSACAIAEILGKNMQDAFN